MAERMHRRARSSVSKVRKARLVRSKSLATASGNDIVIVNIPEYYVKEAVIQRARVLNVPIVPGREFNIPVGGMAYNQFIYKIEVRNGKGVAWKLERSYNEFRQLHSKIKQKFPAITRLIKSFPKRRILSPSPDSAAALYRQKFFQAYLQALLQLQPRIIYVNDFLELHQHTNAVNKKTILSLEDFELLKLLGKGSFGKVFLVRVVGSSDLYAMKVLKKEDVVKRKQVEHTKTELRVMGGAVHPFIVTLRHAFQNDTRLFMVSDFCQGGELFYHLKLKGKFEPNVVQFYTAEISLALHYLHSNGIIYRDLKPENILLDQAGHIQITDFGLSRDKMKDPNGARTFCGTPEYLAPEMLTGRSKNVGYGFAVDWWGLGILTYEMFAGLPPFYDKNKRTMMQKIVRGKLDLRKKPMPKEAKSCIMGFLDRNPERRLGIKGEGFIEIRKHQFYSEFNGGIDFDRLMQKKIDPPMAPKNAVNLIDNFDNAFTRQQARISDDRPIKKSKAKSTNEFDDFDEDAEEEDVFKDFEFTRTPDDIFYEVKED